jgi:uncharacterized protein with GYD domain
MGSDHAVGRHSGLESSAWSLWRSRNFDIEQVGVPARAASQVFVHPSEDDMATFLFTIDWTDQGIRAVKEAPKRSAAAKELARKLGVEIKEIYLTSGEHDLLVFAEAPLGDNIPKFALALSSLGNVRTCTSRVWSEPEWTKLISELP